MMIRSSRNTHVISSTRSIAALLLLCAVFLPGCASKQPASNKIQVIASIEPLAWFVERIGGDRVAVSVMVPSGGNPHTYEPTPRQMADVSNAALFVKAGSGVEFELDWMQRLVDLNKKMAVCNASEGVTLLPMSAETHEHEESAEEHHDHGNFDPHFWLAPANARLIAANVERSLEAVDPAGKEYYAANAAALDKELQALDGEIRKQLSGVKSRRFLVFHPAWGYFAHEYGLEQIAAEEEGKTLTPRQMEAVIGQARSAGIRVVFLAPQFSSAQAEAIAADIGGQTVTVDPLARDYAKNLRKAAAAFAKSLQ
ncbi:zinc ABC transporter substrate-binding protein [Chlorobaculum sp. MV4-Y]|jgi:zinc transport system substrate-binding protein|uniref:metal ABC transporter solute-binding protein, Zn/Mn family n=1 Tax=Chlorobaculum sp. MV4-Y TaxID=2976335 RepID=UPI0021AF90F9|nr:zinc ABC transporter substrate-binding protein [Chlorobaculum sp. MV4-Y]UWX57470.1 zinc ABC transporter substrate-binding protein [Chlorobaculum sp. MV4-Y]